MTVAQVINGACFQLLLQCTLSGCHDQLRINEANREANRLKAEKEEAEKEAAKRAKAQKQEKDQVEKEKKKREAIDK